MDHGHHAAENLAQKGINKLRKLRGSQTGKGLITHTTLGAIKAGNLRRNMLVGHTGRKRATRRKTAPVKRRHKTTKRKHTKTQTGGNRKRRTKTKRRTAKRRKTARSIDIFDI